jgi:hypothetical protein
MQALLVFALKTIFKIFKNVLKHMLLRKQSIFLPGLHAIDGFPSNPGRHLHCPR